MEKSKVQSIVHVNKARRLSRLQRKSVIGQLILLILATECFVFASFTAFDLPTATARNLNSFVIDQVQILISHTEPALQKRIFKAFPVLAEPTREVRYTPYVPLVPVAILLGYSLGSLLGLAAAALFLIIGLVGPLCGVYILAGGGGIDYYLQPSFGYLCGIVLGSCVVGLVSSDRRTSVSQFLSLCLGLLIIHLSGLVYMLGIALFFAIFDDPSRSLTWMPWLFEQARNLTWYSLPYDFLFAFIAIGLGYPLKWLAQILTAPDIALKEHASEGQNFLSA